MKKSKVILVLLTLIISCGKQLIQVREYYDDGSLKLVYETIAGLKNGKMIEYYPNGNIKSQSNWVNDTLNGLSVGYYESGIIESTIMWLNGEIHGNYVKFDEEGYLSFTTTYQFNKKCGYEMRYHDGILYQSHHYILLKDSSYFNQRLNFDGFGNIRNYLCNFYSIYLPYGDTVQINQKAGMIVVLETPNYFEGNYQNQLVTGKWTKNFGFINEQSIDTFFVNNIYIPMTFFADRSGIKYNAGIILNPYFDENGRRQEQKFYFSKPFYVVE